MIGVVGQMSSGKSYFAVECIRHWLMHGHFVATNIRLNCQGVTWSTSLPCLMWKRLYFYLTDDDHETGYHVIFRGDYSKYPVGSPRGSADYDDRKVFIVLDEVSSVFDSMVHASDSSVQAVAAWAKHSHKRGQEMYLIMQFASELHKRLRVHITSYISCVNTSTYKLPFIGSGVPWFLRGYSVRRQLLADCETVVGSPQWVRISPLVYRMYDTSQIVVGQLYGESYSHDLERFSLVSLIVERKRRVLQCVLILGVIQIATSILLLCFL